MINLYLVSAHFVIATLLPVETYNLLLTLYIIDGYFLGVVARAVFPGVYGSRSDAVITDGFGFGVGDADIKILGS